VLRIDGKDAEKAFALEPGIHRIQRVPPTEKRGRRHTSTVAVAILACPSDMGFSIPQSDLRFETIRGQGAGGQHRNTRDTAVRVTHIPTGTNAYADGRSQHRNKENAIAVLGARLKAFSENEKDASTNTDRRGQIGTMGRGTRVRNYDLFRGIVKDERCKKKFNPKRILAGGLDKIYTEITKKESLDSQRNGHKLQ